MAVYDSVQEARHSALGIEPDVDGIPDVLAGGALEQQRDEAVDVGRVVAVDEAVEQFR